MAFRRYKLVNTGKFMKDTGCNVHDASIRGLDGKRPMQEHFREAFRKWIEEVEAEQGKS
jgi:hypothetical protein